MWKKSLLDSSKGKNIDFIFVDNSNDTKYVEAKSGLDMVPDWYKNMLSITHIQTPDGQKEELTVKRCMPVFDALVNGYFLVTSIDYHVSKDDLGDTVISCALPGKSIPITMHQAAQISGMPIPDEYQEYIYKWYNPYSIKTPKGYSIEFTQPLNRFDLPFMSISGVVDTDKYFSPVQFPFMLKKDFIGVIPKGTPIIQIIPFKREGWKMNIHSDINQSVSEEYKKLSIEYERNRYDKSGNLLGNIYKRRFRTVKKYL